MGLRFSIPLDWKVNSTANDSLSSPPITGASTDVVASITSPSDLQRGRQGLVTISVENLSKAAHLSMQMEILTAYDYVSPIIKQLSLTLGSATERGQTNLVRNESLNIGSETSSKNSKNLSAWRIDTIASNYKSDVFVINGTRVFDIGFSAPKENATQSLPIFDKMLNSFQFTVTTPNVTANEDTLNTKDITNASVTSNQSTIPLNEIVQQKPLSQLSSSLIPLPSQQQLPSTFQTEQQQPLPPSSNISQQQLPSNIHNTCKRASSGKDNNLFLARLCNNNNQSISHLWLNNSSCRCHVSAAVLQQAGSADHSQATYTAIDADYSTNSVIAPE